MLTAPQLDVLTVPVIKCAAVAGLGINGFSDRAAQFVLERLGLLSECQNVDCIECEAQIRCSSWIDSQVTKFLTIHPEAQGIELDSGLSTRFHRISDLMDWPRFSWQCINKPEVNDCLNFVFSQMENYRSIAAESPQLSWSKYLGWKGASETIIVIGEDCPLSLERDFDHLHENIKSVRAIKLTKFQLIIRHRIPRLYERLKSEFPDVVCAGVFIGNSGKRSYQRMLRRLMGFSTSDPIEELVCLSFDNELIS